MSNTSSFKSIMEAAMKSIPTQEAIANLQMQVPKQPTNSGKPDYSKTDTKYRDMAQTINDLELIAISYRKEDVSTEDAVTQMTESLQTYADKYGADILSDLVSDPSGDFAQRYDELTGHQRFDELLHRVSYSSGSTRNLDFDNAFDKYREEMRSGLERAQYDPEKMTSEEYCSVLATYIMRDVDKTAKMSNNYQKALDDALAIEQEIRLNMGSSIEFE